MMSDTLTLTGQVAITPDAGTEEDLSGDFAIKVPLSVTTTLDGKMTTTLELVDLNPVTVPLAAIANSADFVVIKSTAPVDVIFSTQFDANQRLQLDGILILDQGSNWRWVTLAFQVINLPPPTFPVRVQITLGARSV
jgi:hypothetical protein